MLGMLTVAVLIPVFVGVNVITNPVVPVVTAVDGAVVTLKLDALVPVKKIVPSVSVPAPVLVIEKVEVVFVPKSVLLLVLVDAPCGTLLPFPLSVRVGNTVTVETGVDVFVHPAALVPFNE